MLGIFKNGLVSAPKELNSPAASFHQDEDEDQHPLNHFSATVFSISFGNDASLAFDPSSNPLHQQRLFCSMDNIYCIFLGSLNNLCTLNKQYGLTKLANEPMFVIQAYKTLRDRGPYPAHSVLKELDGSFGFILYDLNSKTVFVSLGADGEVKLFWGIAADGSVVISDNLEAIKSTCSKSFAPFPTDYEERIYRFHESLDPPSFVNFNELLQGLVNAKFISVSATPLMTIFSERWNIPVLPSLMKLELDVNTSNWILLLHWLESCPNLKVLSLNIKQAKPEEELQETVEEEVVPSCLSSCIKEINIKKLGKVDHEEILIYLWYNAKVLDKLTVDSRLLKIVSYNRRCAIHQMSGEVISI